MFVGERSFSNFPWPLAAALVLCVVGVAGFVRTIDTPQYSQLAIPTLARRHASGQTAAIGQPEVAAFPSAELLVVSAAHDLPAPTRPPLERQTRPPAETAITAKVPSAPSDVASLPAAPPAPDVTVRPEPDEVPLQPQEAIVSAATAPLSESEETAGPTGPAVSAAGLPGPTEATPIPVNAPGKSELAPGHNKDSDGKLEKSDEKSRSRPEQSPSRPEHSQAGKPKPH